MSADTPIARSHRRAAMLRLLRPFAGLAVVIGLFAALEPDVFLSAYNLKTVATQTVIVGLGALGMTFVIVAGGIDLAAGSTIALSSVVTAALLRAGWTPLPAATAGVLTGALAGMISGLLVVGLRVVPFIATLGMMGVARGLAKLFAEEQKIDAPPGWLSSAMSKAPEDTWLSLPPGVWLLFGLAAVMGLILRHTPLGLHTAAIGSNERTARLCGVPVGRRKIAIYAICGAFAGLAGVMTFARLTVGDPTTAVGAELDIIAAVVIGGASLSGGSGSILGSLLGAFLMAFLANGCNLTGVPNYVQEILIGGIIVAAVAVDQFRRPAA